MAHCLSATSRCIGNHDKNGIHRRTGHHNHHAWGASWKGGWDFFSPQNIENAEAGKKIKIEIQMKPSRNHHAFEPPRRQEYQDRDFALLTRHFPGFQTQRSWRLGGKKNTSWFFKGLRSHCHFHGIIFSLLTLSSLCPCGKKCLND